jgi:hypothetical protein
MTGKTSTLALLVALTLISAGVVAALIGCNEHKEIKAPVIGPAAGSGPIGGGETQQIKLIANPSTTVPTIGEDQATVNITALVENNIGQPMPDGTAVYWSTTVGTLDSSTTTTSNGSSTVTLTFPKSYTGCSVVTAQSGDVEASIKVCTNNLTPTPTDAPTATPTGTPIPTATAGPTPTPAISITLVGDRVTTTCGAITSAAPAVMTATVYRNSVPATDLLVEFDVSFSPALGGTSDCDVNPSNPPLGTFTTDFYCTDCTGFTITTATISVRETTSGNSATWTMLINP